MMSIKSSESTLEARVIIACFPFGHRELDGVERLGHKTVVLRVTVCSTKLGTRICSLVCEVARLAILLISILK